MALKLVPMCGRYIPAQQTEAAAAFGVQRLRWLEMTSYNVAPAREVPVIRAGEGEREGVMMRWGLIPPFLKGDIPKYATSNARLETMQTSPAFRDPWKKLQRCIVPAEGFYEWHQPVGRPRQPWFVGLANKGVMPLAGLWDRSIRPDGYVIESFAIVTLPANELLARIDNEEKRMPAILRMDDVETWLSGSADEAHALLTQFPAQQMRAYTVSARVNSAKNDDAALLDEVAN